MGRGGSEVVEEESSTSSRRKRRASVVVANDESVRYDSSELVDSTTEDSPVTFILYLIRHGEAEHNVREKMAKDATKAEAVSRGLDPHGPEVMEAMEQARKAVLQDCQLCDPPLSDAGKAMAAAPRKALDVLHAGGLPPPSCVLVSPLQRTLQTAALVFPGHDKVLVCEALKERQTLLACDTRSSAEELVKRGTFAHMNLSEIVREDEKRKELRRSATAVESSEDSEAEDKNMLRLRTLQVLELLEEQRNHQSVALVGHKGYLRELERGPFCRTDATECSNGEVRVYKISVIREAGGDRRVLADRLHPSDAPADGAIDVS
eukprot:CAMPEP_0115853734 /NCGR_PEP_ID=MMETSP0287-20121206/13658_1 /TAXON_ID=412157 /ORGANISM="Chrysochromulina rotalis, Strain UIO044" /LENGTH=319 /DNA_ID=CAMNT_0003307823 /DNA_START=16 /DNA_END=975 /DNA_ORIENTATION=+